MLGPIRAKSFAQEIQAMLGRVTGDATRIVGGRDGWTVQRYTGSEWVNG